MDVENVEIRTPKGRVFFKMCKGSYSNSMDKGITFQFDYNRLSDGTGYSEVMIAQDWLGNQKTNMTFEEFQRSVIEDRLHTKALHVQVV